MQPGGYWTSLNVVSEQWAMFYLGSLGPAWAPLKLLGLGVLLIFLTNLIVKNLGFEEGCVNCGYQCKYFNKTKSINLKT